MAYPVHFPECNKSYGAPEGVSPEDVGTLHVWQGTIDDEALGRHSAIISCWQFSLEDLEHLARNGGKFFLMLSANVQPVVSIAAKNPFE